MAVEIGNLYGIIGKDGRECTFDWDDGKIMTISHGHPSLTSPLLQP